MMAFADLPSRAAVSELPGRYNGGDFREARVGFGCVAAQFGDLVEHILLVGSLAEFAVRLCEHRVCAASIMLIRIELDDPLQRNLRELPFSSGDQLLRCLGEIPKIVGMLDAPFLSICLARDL